MAPTSNAATPPRRQSCNRCHGQKLRCTRANKSGPGACNRCIRQGAQCVYSSSLPKGRPSMYRLADASTASSNPSQIHPAPGTPASPEVHRRLPTGLITVANVNATNMDAINNNTNANNGTYSKANSDANVIANTHPNGNIRDVNDDTMMFGHSSTSTWPCPWATPMNWSDTLFEGNDQEPNFHSIIDPQTDPGAVFSSDFPNFVGSSSPQNSDGGSSPRGWPVSPTVHGQYFGSEVFDMSSNSSINVKKNNPEFGVAQLSQLSTRLYPLCQSSCTLAEAAESSILLRDREHAHQSPLIDDAAFKSVTSWLVHVSSNMNFLFRDNIQKPSLEMTTTGDTLHNAFAASHHLLEIIRNLQVDVDSGFSFHASGAPASADGGSNVDFWASITPKSLSSTIGEKPSYFEATHGPSYVRRPSQCYNTVVRHLVIACHTLLLNVHVALLIVIQHDADLRSSFSTPTNIEANSHIDATALADIRLVLVLRLCSYLIKRQQQAVDSYLSPRPSPRSPRMNDPSVSQQPNSGAPGTANREATSDLEIEVQQRLERLRQTLCI
ncbi:hypothetical protein V494_05928 [Pseudogymnoascus sp. VKM F-4513 (FW-928)]|nr:hypothetical protein V494_05928 [Pseudogymnoascus sp. VKM F-4513 (FW-928)]